MAGAGSGKTRVLTRRIAWLVSERKAHPGSILAITFTNKAAAEMKERVEELVGKRARIMWVSTFHSACVRILRKEITRGLREVGFSSSFSIYDAADQKRLMTLVAKELDLDPKRFQPGALLHWVSNHKNELRDEEDAARDAKNKLEETYAAAYALYQRRLREANALDFDDLIMLTVHLFQAVPGRARDLPAPVPARAGRRVPGHQPRAVRVHPRAVRRLRSTRPTLAAASGSRRPS